MPPLVEGGDGRKTSLLHAAHMETENMSLIVTGSEVGECYMATHGHWQRLRAARVKCGGGRRGKVGAERQEGTEGR